MNFREWALPVYSILIQLAIGAMLVLWILRWLASTKFSPGEMNRIIRNPILVILFTAIVAMIGAHFHLSKPFYSFYAVSNFKTSWLSREIVFTVLFFYILLALWIFSRSKRNYRNLVAALGWSAILIGLILVYCMARIYMLPTQVAWNTSAVIVSFYTTTALLGSMTIACLLVLDLEFAEIQKTKDIAIRKRVIEYSLNWLVVVASLAVIVDIAVTFYQIHLLSQGGVISQTSLQLLFKLYTPLFALRLFFIIVAPCWIGYAVYRMRKVKLSLQELTVPVYMSCLLILVGEIVGRFLFYATHIRIGL